jgi:uncharacterized protein (TIGR02596 family)
MNLLTTARTCRPGPQSASARGGFTLVEMLVVLAIIAILATMALPSVRGMLGSMDLRGAANVVVAQMELARQTASTRNVQVEVRIYQDSNVLDPTAKASAYRIIAVVIPALPNGTPADEFVSPGLPLPGDIVFDQTTTPNDYSTLLDPATLDTSGTPRSLATEAATAPAPFQLQKKPYMKFTYLANGTVNLTNTSTTSSNWCLSIRSLHAMAATTPHPAPAANFVTLLLDPTTGRARVYQPQ